MTKRPVLNDWSLAAFTLAIQFACGIAIATAIAAAQISTQPATTATPRNRPSSPWSPSVY